MATAKKKESLSQEAMRYARQWTSDAGRQPAAQFAISAVEYQRKAMHNALKGIGKLQDQTGKLVLKMAQGATWMPDEGRQVVDEWNKATQRGREDFEKTMNKSFDLLSAYFERVKKGQTGKKTVARKRAPAKRKPATKAKAAASSATSES